MNQHKNYCHSILKQIVMALLLAQIFVGIIDTSLALSVRSVEDLQGHINPGTANFYIIPNLQEGDSLYLYGRGTSGNFDPFLAVGNSTVNASQLATDFEAEVEMDIEEGRDPLEAIPETANRYFLAWDDDGGDGYNAAVKFQVPASGNYQLFLSSSPGRRTFGEYLLQVGVNAPQVLTGQAVANREGIALLDKNLSEIGYAVQEINGNLTANKTSTFYNLNPLSREDRFYAFIEATSGDLMPVLILTDYGNKTLRTGNWGGMAKNAMLQFSFKDASENNRIMIKSGLQNGNLNFWKL
jgi:hypothetical protein